MERVQIVLVQASLSRLSLQAAGLAARFYARLFALDPSLRPLFTGDMNKQGLKLMMTLQHLVGALDEMATVRPKLEQLARNHVSYGVRDEHYDTLRVALLDALAAAHGPEFSPQLRDAWTAAYDQITGVMRTAAATVDTQRDAA